jgi:hypothetical protein
VLNKLGGVLRRTPARSFGLPTPMARMWLPLPAGLRRRSRTTPLSPSVSRPLSVRSKRRGDLAFFNQAYKARRTAAAAQGHVFMSYGLALRRLRQAVAGAAADGGQCTRSLMLSVFAAKGPEGDGES